MARLPKQNMTPGLPAKPPGLPKAVAVEWDRIVSKLVDSNIQVSKAHGLLIEQAATVAADIAEALKTIKEKGAYYKNVNTGAMMIHPAARRADSLRRDYVKILSLLGLRSAVSAPPDDGNSLDEMLDE